MSAMSTVVVALPASIISSWSFSSIAPTKARGDIRAALALLLRDTLVTFFRRHPTPLTPGATEQDCLRAYRRLLGDTPAVVYLERLTEAWTRTAWAHRPTTPEQVQALYDQWRGLRPAEART